MKLRLMQLLLFLPCCFIDGLFVFICFPIWVVCGISITTHEGALDWLMELNNNEGGNK
jgi:hypothetical protein